MRESSCGEAHSSVSSTISRLRISEPACTGCPRPAFDRSSLPCTVKTGRKRMRMGRPSRPANRDARELMSGWTRGPVRKEIAVLDFHDKPALDLLQPRVEFFLLQLVFNLLGHFGVGLRCKLIHLEQIEAVGLLHRFAYAAGL